MRLVDIDRLEEPLAGHIQETFGDVNVGQRGEVMSPISDERMTGREAMIQAAEVIRVTSSRDQTQVGVDTRKHPISQLYPILAIFVVDLLSHISRVYEELCPVVRYEIRHKS